MNLINLNPSFTNSPYLTKPIQRQLVETLPFKDFDKDGYEVPTPLEHLHYEINGVELNREIQYHIAPVQEWYTDTEQSEHGLVLDHCMLLTRYAFAGEAIEQIEEVSRHRPILQKLLNIKPKWGIDFSLDYVTHDIVMEVIHIEQDFDNLEEAQEAKERLEQIIDDTDWYDGAMQLYKRRDEWINLSSDDHSDYKAQFFGWARAFDNKKVF
jgi:PAS domain-containing protein